MQYAQQRDALRQKKFHFRKSLPTRQWTSHAGEKQSFRILDLGQTPDTPSMTSLENSETEDNSSECEHRPMTINEIINGSVRVYPCTPIHRSVFDRRTNLWAF